MSVIGVSRATRSGGLVVACAVLFALTAGLGGCGGGSAATVPPAATSPSPSVSPPPQALQLKQYFAAILPAFASADRANKSWAKAQKVFDAKQQVASAFPAFRKVVERYVSSTTSNAVAITAVVPPRSLARAHASLLKSYSEDYDLAVFVRESLRLEEPYSTWWRGWESRGTVEEKTYHLWTVAVRAEAIKLGVKIPPKLRKVM
jgi:hypothetical protein